MKKLMLVVAFVLSCTQDFEKYRHNSSSSGGGGQAGGPVAGGGDGPGGQLIAGGGEGGDGGVLVGAGPIGGDGGEPLGGFGGDGGSAGDGGTGGTPTGGGGTGGDGGTGGFGGGCDVSEKECNGSCVSPLPANGCDDLSCNPCPTYPHSSTVCMGGDGPCLMMCNDLDYEDCDMNDATGCEAHLPDDPMHCGMCNNPCPSGSCVDGMCENVDLCGSQPVPTTGYVVCWDLDSSSLSAGRYGTITVERNSPAPSGANDQITAGCVSQQASTANESTNPDVLCSLADAVVGDTVYLALKAYYTNTGNPPLPFFAFMCDNQDAANGKCRGSMKVYKAGTLIGTFTHPPAGAFSYHDTNIAEPLQLKVLLP